MLGFGFHFYFLLFKERNTGNYFKSVFITEMFSSAWANSTCMRGHTVSHFSCGRSCQKNSKAMEICAVCSTIAGELYSIIMGELSSGSHCECQSCLYTTTVSIALVIIISGAMTGSTIITTTIFIML